MAPTHTTNDEEVVAGTDPTNPDTDGDGINDGDEYNGPDGDPLTMGRIIQTH